MPKRSTPDVDAGLAKGLAAMAALRDECFAGDAKGAARLIESGGWAQVDSRGGRRQLHERLGDEGFTLMFLALAKPASGVPELLLANGYFLGARGRFGHPILAELLAWTPSLPRLPAIRWALDHGAEVDDAGSDGETALIAACDPPRADTAEIVQELIGRGANPFLRDKQGRSARDAAAAMNQLAIAGQLEAYERSMVDAREIKASIPAGKHGKPRLGL